MIQQQQPLKMLTTPRKTPGTLLTRHYDDNETGCSPMTEVVIVLMAEGETSSSGRGGETRP